MKSIHILMFLALVSACGVKGPPLPPVVALTPRQSDMNTSAAARATPTPTPIPTEKTLEKAQ